MLFRAPWPRSHLPLREIAYGMLQDTHSLTGRLLPTNSSTDENVNLAATSVVCFLRAKSTALSREICALSSRKTHFPSSQKDGQSLALGKFQASMPWSCPSSSSPPPLSLNGDKRAGGDAALEAPPERDSARELRTGRAEWRALSQTLVVSLQRRHNVIKIRPLGRIG